MHELIAPSINFGILMVVLGYLLRKPVKDMVANRQLAIKTQVEEARAQKAEAERRYNEFTQKLRSFEAEAQSMLDKAKADAEALKAKIIRDAHATAERIVKDADAAADANVQEFKDQLRRDTIAKAVELAEKMVRERLSSDDQKRIVHEYVGKVQ